MIAPINDLASDAVDSSKMTPNCAGGLKTGITRRGRGVLPRLDRTRCPFSSL